MSAPAACAALLHLWSLHLAPNIPGEPFYTPHTYGAAVECRASPASPYSLTGGAYRNSFSGAHGLGNLNPYGAAGVHVADVGSVDVSLFAGVVYGYTKEQAAQRWGLTPLAGVQLSYGALAVQVMPVVQGAVVHFTLRLFDL